MAKPPMPVKRPPRRVRRRSEAVSAKVKVIFEGHQQGMTGIGKNRRMALEEVARAALAAGREMIGAEVSADAGAGRMATASQSPFQRDGKAVLHPGTRQDGVRKSENALAFAAILGRDWAFLRRAEQAPPEGDWRNWLILGGRGSGKTRAGAEWVHELATRHPLARELRIALVAETLGDAREVMIDGPPGFAGSPAFTGRTSRPRAAGWSGRAGRWRRFFPPRIPRVCAGRSFISPGRTNWRSGGMRRKAGTCCNSGCGWGNGPGS